MADDSNPLRSPRKPRAHRPGGINRLIGVPDVAAWRYPGLARRPLQQGRLPATRERYASPRTTWWRSLDRSLLVDSFRPCEDRRLRHASIWNEPGTLRRKFAPPPKVAARAGKTGQGGGRPRPAHRARRETISIRLGPWERAMDMMRGGEPERPAASRTAVSLRPPRSAWAASWRRTRKPWNRRPGRFARGIDLARPSFTSYPDPGGRDLPLPSSRARNAGLQQASGQVEPTLTAERPIRPPACFAARPPRTSPDLYGSLPDGTLSRLDSLRARPAKPARRVGGAAPGLGWNRPEVCSSGGLRASQGPCPPPDRPVSAIASSAACSAIPASFRRPCTHSSSPWTSWRACRA